MADKKRQRRKNIRSIFGRQSPIDTERPVNMPITLPSALKPAKPPKGIKWDRPDVLAEAWQRVAENQGEEVAKTGDSDRREAPGNRPVNEKITLPSALEPAKPPRGIKWDRPDILADAWRHTEKQQGEEDAEWESRPDPSIKEP